MEVSKVRAVGVSIVAQSLLDNRRGTIQRWACGALVLCALWPAPVASIAWAQTSRVSVTTSGAEVHGDSIEPVLSWTGRFVAFSSNAQDVVAPPNPIGTSQVYLRDRDPDEDGIFDELVPPSTTTLVSHSTSGSYGIDNSQQPSISRDGRYVAFQSAASDLVIGDGNMVSDIFVWDRTTNEIERVSIGHLGQQANFASKLPAISGDGQFVAFVTDANNLLAIDDTNGTDDVIVFQRGMSGGPHPVSLDSGDHLVGGSILGHGSITADGQYVVFVSSANQIVAGDMDGNADIFRFHWSDTTAVKVQVHISGVQANAPSGVGGVISDDANLVAFQSFASNLVPDDMNGGADVFVRDIAAGTTVRVRVTSDEVEADGDSGIDTIGISADGRFVAFASNAGNLDGDSVASVAAIYVRDRQAGTTRLESRASNGEAAETDCRLAQISASSCVIAFSSTSTNLVAMDEMDENASEDAFVRLHLLANCCLGDADGNNLVNFDDVLRVLASFGDEYAADCTGAGDADCDGNVDFNDILTVLAQFGEACGG